MRLLSRGEKEGAGSIIYIPKTANIYDEKRYAARELYQEEEWVAEEPRARELI